MNQEELNSRLSEIKDKLFAVEQQSDNRIYLSCESENSYAVNKFLFEDVPLRFVIATGIDSDDCFEILYHYSYDQTGCVITIKAYIRDRENPVIESIAPFLPAAEWIEREMHDILGIEFKNHPDMRRLILADDWPEGVYPMRKDTDVEAVKLRKGERPTRPSFKPSPPKKEGQTVSPILAVGPFHPLQEEMEFFQLTIDGEIVTDIDMRLSYNHRGIEKISESLQFDQIPFLVSRICGICSATHPLAYVQAVEDIAGVKPPERALYVRTIINELERIHSHLLWVGLAGHFIGYDTVFMWAWKYREPVLDLLEEITGNRNNYGNVKVGGCRENVPNELIPKILKELDEIEKKTEMLTKAVLDDPVLHARLKGVGILSKEDAIRYAVTGPTARGSGVAIDVRRDDPYAAYADLDWNVIVQPEGDVFAKAVVRLLETFESIKIVRQALKKLPDGPVAVEVKEIPPGEAVGHAEAPRGETFHYVRSDGGNRPVRHKVRAPSYVNVPSFKASCIGGHIADVTLTLAAVDPCYSCTERLAIVDSRNNVIHDYDALLKLSREKTARISKELGAPELKMEDL
ncbi:MAG TPA: NADH-quinone oxidoreductase subunit C [Sedimentisphaerales bacterium]|nr:NADH-quinone oxidoreductase subunit C [Sedimentisphaerales bacterium]